jgi:RNA polymerase sigma factor (sigma-70 family)
MDAELDDAELVARCRRGEARGWNALVLRYKRLIYAIPRRAGLDEHHAADVFQVVFATLHRHLARIDDPTRLHAWIVTTAKRETLRVLREGRRSFASTGDADDDAIASIPDPAPLADAKLVELETNHRLRLAFDRLDDRCRELLGALYLDDDAPSYAELGRRLGCPEGSVGPTRARCLAKLRALADAAGVR